MSGNGDPLGDRRGSRESRAVAGPPSGRVRLGLGIVVGLVALLLAGGGVLLAMRPPPAPQQPIEFSHATHAGEFGIDCEYCHASARRSQVAGLPAVSTCAGCHKVVLPEAGEVQKIQAFLERQEPIPWLQVYDLPEYVRFTHAPHVRAGVECASCHGDVASMQRVHRVRDLTMGWCLDCHRRQAAPDDCLFCHY